MYVDYAQLVYSTIGCDSANTCNCIKDIRNLCNYVAGEFCVTEFVFTACVAALVGLHGITSVHLFPWYSHKSTATTAIPTNPKWAVYKREPRYSLHLHM